jgi:hypothetical protein
MSPLNAILAQMKLLAAFDILNNRELATIIWIVLIFVALLFIRPVRADLAKVGRTLIGPPLLETFVLLLSYVVLLAWTGHALGIWTTDLISETVWWFVGTALVLLFNVTTAGGERGFFRRTLVQVFGVTLLIDFFMNDLFVLSLPVELFLVAAITLLGLVTLAARMDPTTLQVASLTGCLMTVIGLGLVTYVIVNVVTNWNEVATKEHLLELLLPVWLTLGFLPFLYLIGIMVGYQSAFNRIEWSLRDRKPLVWKVQVAMVSVLRGKPRYAANLFGRWIEDAAAAGSLRGMRAVFKDYRRTVEERDERASRERDRLEHYAGVPGTDSQGLQLDRREFRETKKALQSLASAQMGWYRNPGSRYRGDLLEIFAANFASMDLPEDDHGVVMRVSEDGQSWYAFRRTVTGWCFAIGASGPPPNQWEFDGPNPPKGFPGTDRSWGDSPFTSSPNWSEPTVDPLLGD